MGRIVTQQQFGFCCDQPESGYLIYLAESWIGWNLSGNPVDNCR